VKKIFGILMKTTEIITQIWNVIPRWVCFLNPNRYQKYLKIFKRAVVKIRDYLDFHFRPTEAIYAEFDRLIQQVEGHLGPVAVESPCLDVAARLQSCLQAHRQRSCNCFAAMEEYRNCVVRATQNRVDDLADMEPPMMPVVPPQVMPPPAVPPPNARGNRRWWKFWTWFR